MRRRALGGRRHARAALAPERSYLGLHQRRCCGGQAYLVLRGLDTVEDDMTAFDDIQVCLSFRVPAEGSGGYPRQLYMMFFV